MKKWLCLLLALLMLLCVGCGKKKDDSKKEEPKSSATTKGKLTKDDALALAEAHWNMKSGDHDPETGYMMSVMITQVPGEDYPYYRAVLRWMVEVDGEPSHMSQLDVVLVHHITGEIIPEGEE